MGACQKKKGPTTTVTSVVIFKTSEIDEILQITIEDPLFSHSGARICKLFQRILLLCFLSSFIRKHIFLVE